MIASLVLLALFALLDLAAGTLPAPALAIEGAAAEQVRRACVEAALAAWEDARLSGLCADGAHEAAVGAIRALDLDRLVRERSAGRGRDGAG